MHDIKFIRENLNTFKDLIKNRQVEDQDLEKVIEIDQKKRNIQFEIQALQQKRNSIAKNMAVAAKKNDSELAAIKQEGREINTQLETLSGECNVLDSQLNEILANIPNVLESDVPYGNDEENNVFISSFGDIKELDFTPKNHVTLAENLKVLDLEVASKLSGARFPFLSGNLAKMERVLINFFIDFLVSKFDYLEVSPPYLVKKEALFGTGQLPKFEDDLFKLLSGHYLIPTGEVPLTNIYSQSILDVNELPIRFVAATPCFRLEAGSAGADTKGLLRQHQFSKVEIVSLVTQENSQKEHMRMVSIVEELLKIFEIPYKVVLLCSGDTGFSASKTYDIEVWLPSKKGYVEISSISNCKDFQARRMKLRYKKEKVKYFAHTLNGSALAIGRLMAAILENYQQANGDVLIPEAIRSYFSTSNL